MIKRLRLDVIIYGNGYKRERKKESRNSRCDYSYKVKFMMLLI